MARKKVIRAKGKKKVHAVRNKIPFVIYQILLFTGLTIVSFILLKLSNKIFWLNFFQIMSITFGFIAVGFLIVLLILWITKMIKRK